MTKRRPARSIRARGEKLADLALGLPDETVLDVLDHLLTKGVMASGDVTLGVAGIDLIYVRLSALLCAADRIMPGEPARQPRARRRSTARRRQS